MIDIPHSRTPDSVEALFRFLRIVIDVGDFDEVSRVVEEHAEG
jgi:hypothetical protein